jgi:hypothetical protein
MQPSLDILANHRDSNQRIAENETRQGAAMVRTLGRRIVRVELNPIGVVDFEEESEAVRADLGAHGGLESDAIGLRREAMLIEGTREWKRERIVA